MRSGTAPCGLRYGVRRGGSAVGYCALSLRSGTRDENGFGMGIAHFVEHTIFRGTRRKSASVIAGYLDRLGGELNAYTTKEEIVLHATVLKEDLGKAARLLFELATEATFPDGEIETERGVVLDEIISYKDNPAEDVYDKFEGMLFEGHPLGRPILGTTASVRKLKPDDLRAFVRTFFTPDRMAFTVVADIDEKILEKRVLKLIGKLFGESDAISRMEGDTVSSASLRDPIRANAPETVSPSIPFDKTVDKHNHEVNAVIGNRAPSLYEQEERITAAVLCNILGGTASNSLLNKELREKNGWVYGVECTYTQYADTGIAAISFGCDKPNLERCLTALDKILARLRDVPMSERTLKAYKKQLLGQLAISSDNGEAQCLSMGKSLLAWGRIDTSAEMRTRIEAVTPEALQAMARRIFDPDTLSRLIYL
ncbi:MAG: insulinase family protein [Bacteroidales bacterium]|nr:insulinase family protein [Bacteroidales bacterium]MBR2748059.1 insulinase family protein [Bacteroidales bacterium]